MELDWTEQAIDQLDWHWREHLRPGLDGLTDDEYRWEPVPGCWSLRPRAEATSPMAAGGGDVVADFAWPEPVPPPVTTIAWRIAHMAVGLFGMRASNHFGDGSVAYETTTWSLTAAGGLALLDGWYREWMVGVRSLGANGMAAPCGPSEGPFSDAPMGALVLHLNREAIHHGAEVLLLRDLYRAGLGR